MTDITDSDTGKATEIRTCPFLGLAWDNTTRYGYPNPMNYCYKIAKAQPVNLKYQGSTCLAGNYLECELFSDNLVLNLPEGIRNEETNSARRKYRDKIIGIFFLVIVFILFIGLIFGYFTRSNYFQAGLNNIADLPSNIASAPPLINIFLQNSPPPTLLGEEKTQLPNSPGANLSTPKPGLATQTPLPTIILPSPTVGPGLETPFGIIKTYLIHLVKTGETIEQVALLYKTTPAVIKKMNFQGAQTSIMLDQQLVIQPGQTSLVQLVPMKAVRVIQKTTVKEFCAQNNLDLVQFSEINGIYGNLIPAGAWIIEAVKK